jgi:hypothetical protein
VESGLSEGIDVVDHSRNTEAGEAESAEMKISYVQDMKSSLQKPESFGKVASPLIGSDRESKYPDDLTDENRYGNQYLFRANCISKHNN